MNVNFNFTNHSSPLIPQEHLIHSDELSSIRENFLKQMTHDSVLEKKLSECSPFPVVIKTLPNGLTVYFLNRKIADSSHPTVSMQIVVKTGHFAETPKERGLAHFLEHCVYLGTQSYSKETIEEKLKLYSDGTGADNNASTNRTTTNFYFEQVSGDLESVENCLNLLHELIFKPTFPEEAVRQEREVLQNEFAVRNDFKQRALYHTFSKVYPNREYLRSLDSELDQIEDSELVDALQTFHQKWYQPHNMALVLVGDLGETKNTTQVLTFIENLFGSVPSAHDKGIPEYILLMPSIPEQRKIKYTVFKDKEYRSLSINFQNRICFSKSLFSCQKLDLNHIYQNLAIQLFSHILKNRLLTEARETNSAFRQVEIPDSLIAITDHLDLWQISIVTAIGKVNEAYRKFLLILKEYTTYGVPKDEFVLTQKILKDRLTKHLKKIDLLSHPTLMDHYQEIFLNPTASQDYRQTLLAKLHVLEHFEPAHLNEAIRHWDIFSMEREISIMGVQGLEGNIEIPALQRILEEVKATDVQKPLEVDLSLDWLPARPVPCSPVKTNVIPLLNEAKDGITLHTFEFANGIQVVLAPVVTQDPTIHIQFIRPYHGHAPQTKNENLALRLAFDCLCEIGLKGKSYKETSRSLNNALINYFVPHHHLNGWTLSSSTNDEKHLEGFLQVIYAWLTDVSNIDSEEFQKAFNLLQKECKKHRTQSLKTPQMQADQRLAEALFQDHPLLSPIQPEDFDEDLYNLGKECLKKHLRHLKGATLVICGPIHLDRVMPLAYSYIGQLEDQPMEKTPGASFVFPKETQSIHLQNGVTSDKTSFYMYLPLPSQQLSIEKVLIARILIDQYLMDKIRFENQQTYTLATKISSFDYPGSDHFFSISIEGSSQQHERVKKEVLKTLDELFSHFSGLSPNEELKEKMDKILAACKTSSTKSRDQSKNRSSYWIEFIRTRILGNREFTSHTSSNEEPKLQIQDLLPELQQICDLKKPSISLTISPHLN